MNNRYRFCFTLLLFAIFQTSMLSAMDNQSIDRQTQIEHILYETDWFISIHEQFRYHGANQQIFDEVRHHAEALVDNFLNGIFEGASPTQQLHIGHNIARTGRLRDDIAIQLGIPRG